MDPSREYLSQADIQKFENEEGSVRINRRIRISEVIAILDEFPSYALYWANASQASRAGGRDSKRSGHFFNNLTKKLLLSWIADKTYEFDSVDHFDMLLFKNKRHIFNTLPGLDQIERRGLGWKQGFVSESIVSFPRRKYNCFYKLCIDYLPFWIRDGLVGPNITLKSFEEIRTVTAVNCLEANSIKHKFGLPINIVEPDTIFPITNRKKYTFALVYIHEENGTRIDSPQSFALGHWISVIPPLESYKHLECLLDDALSISRGEEMVIHPYAVNDRIMKVRKDQSDRHQVMVAYDLETYGIPVYLGGEHVANEQSVYAASWMIVPKLVDVIDGIPHVRDVSYQCNGISYPTDGYDELLDGIGTVHQCCSAVLGEWNDNCFPIDNKPFLTVEDPMLEMIHDVMRKIKLMARHDYKNWKKVNIIFYAHNGACFDTYFLHDSKALKYFGGKEGWTMVEAPTGMLNASCFVHTFTRSLEDKNLKLPIDVFMQFRDSMKLVSPGGSGLAALGKTFKIPHKYRKKENFDVTKVTKENYLDLKPEWMPYLKNDVMALACIILNLEKMYSSLILERSHPLHAKSGDKHEWIIAQTLTAASFAALYGSENNVKYSTVDSSSARFLRGGLYGGRVQVLRTKNKHRNFNYIIKYFEERLTRSVDDSEIDTEKRAVRRGADKTIVNKCGSMDIPHIVCYDATSLYPSAMARWPCHPNCKTESMWAYNHSGESLDDYMERLDRNKSIAFIHVEKVIPPDHIMYYIPVGYRSPTGVKYDQFPMNNQTYTSIEIKELKKAKVTLIGWKKALVFEGEDGTLQKTINVLFQMRKDNKYTKPTVANTCKLILNSTYGKFCQHDRDEFTFVCDDQTALVHCLRGWRNGKKTGIIDIGNFPPQELGNGLLKVKASHIVDWSVDDDQELCNPSHLGAECLSNSKRIMNEFMKPALESPLAYYCDTDSMYVTEKYSQFLDRSNFPAETELGGIKNDYGDGVVILAAYFLAPKTKFVVVYDPKHGIYTKSSTKGTNLSSILINGDRDHNNFDYMENVLYGGRRQSNLEKSFKHTMLGYLAFRYLSYDGLLETRTERWDRNRLGKRNPWEDDSVCTKKRHAVTIYPAATGCKRVIKKGTHKCNMAEVPLDGLKGIDFLNHASYVCVPFSPRYPPSLMVQTKTPFPRPKRGAIELDPVTNKRVRMDKQATKRSSPSDSSDPKRVERE